MSEQTATAQAASIVVNQDSSVRNEEFVFRFKKDKLGNKRPDLKIVNPVITAEGIVKILETGGKGLELLLDSANDTYRSAIASWVSETAEADATQEKFPLDKFTWDAIANQDKKDRRTVQISDETWTGFSSDYLEVMKRVQPNRTEEQHKAAIQVYLLKFVPFKSDKKILKNLQNALTIYIENTQNGEEYSDILELLTRRLENYLAADDMAALAAALG